MISYFKPADIILTYKKNLLNKAILFVMNLFQTDSVRYAHAILVKNESVGIEAHNEIREIDLNKELSKVTRYVVIRHLNLTDEQREKIVKKAECCIGQKYGVFRLILQLLDQMTFSNFFTRLFGFKRHICSTLVSWAYYVITKIRFNGVNWKSCEPDDILDEAEKYPELYEFMKIKK
jgi:hypothetical protein